MENSKLTGMIVTDLRKEIAEQYKEIECLKKERDATNLQNQELQKTLEHIKDSAMDDTRSKAEIYGIASCALAINKNALKRNCEECGNPCNCKERPAQHLNHLCRSKYHDPGWYE